MKRLLVCVLLAGVVGCGESQRAAHVEPHQQQARDELTQLGCRVVGTADGENEPIVFRRFDAQGANRITDDKLVLLQALPDLSSINLNNTQVTDAGIVYLKGMINLGCLDIGETQITDAGWVELLKALRNSKIRR